jgi:uncharacterized protein YaaQ
MKAALVRQQRQDIANPVADCAQEATPVPPLGTLAELDQLLMEHARQATTLAIAAGGIKAAWLDFVDQAPAQQIPIALSIVTQVGRIRSEMVDETIRIAEILHGINRTANTFNVAQTAVLVTPTNRRRNQAE